LVLRNLIILFGLCGTVSASPALFPVVAGDLEARDQTNPLAETERVQGDAETVAAESPKDEASSESSASSTETTNSEATNSEANRSEAATAQPATDQPAEDAEPLKATLTPDELNESPELAPAPPAPKVKTVPDVVKIITGEASWYGPGFYGNRTASGEIYRPGTMTAAHRTLPFGTKVRVTNLWNGRSAVIRINDRGPFVGHRVIDLGHGAASSLGLTASGIAQVRLEVLR
jgi:rare lipoprotein A